jgi:hypothetical protein
MEYIIFTRARLSYVRVIMTFLLVSLVEPLRQAAMGWIPTLEYMLSGVYGLLRPSLVMPGSKCHRFLRPLVLVMLIHCRKPQGVLTRCPSLVSGQGGRQDEQTGGKILPAHIYRKDEE